MTYISQELLSSIVVDDGILKKGTEDECETDANPHIDGLDVRDRRQFGVDTCN